MQEQIIAGDVAKCSAICCVVEETGPFGTLILMGYDWDDRQLGAQHGLFAPRADAGVEQGVGRRDDR